MHSQFFLLKQKSFLPFFIVQFLGAFNDNVIKNALVVMITFSTTSHISSSSAVLIAIASALFILPFFIASATAGKVGDKFRKSEMIKWLKLSELLIMVPATLGFYSDNIWLLMFTLFLLGAQAAFFGPIKYGIIPELVHEDELVAATGLTSAGTFIAILAGTLTGVMLIRAENGMYIIATIIIVAAVAGYATSFMVPKTADGDSSIIPNKNPLADTRQIVMYSLNDKTIFSGIVLISWFWFLGATFLAQLSIFVKEYINGNEAVIGFFLTCFTVGTGIGSMLCNRILKGQVNPKLSLVGTAGIAAAIFFLNLSVAELPKTDWTQLGLLDFILEPKFYQTTLFIFLVSVFGGLHIVPLYAFIQKTAEPHHRAQVIASNNIMNAGFMVISSLLTIVMAKSGFSINAIFFAVGLTGAAAAVWSYKIFHQKA